MERKHGAVGLRNSSAGVIHMQTARRTLGSLESTTMVQPRPPCFMPLLMRFRNTDCSHNLLPLAGTLPLRLILIRFTRVISAGP